MAPAWGAEQRRLARLWRPERSITALSRSHGNRAVIEAGGEGALYAKLLALRSVVQYQGRAERTWVKNASALRYFVQFCRVSAVNPDAFGRAGAMTPRDEEAVLEMFASFVVHCPRAAGKGRNTGEYAASCVGAVREYVLAEHGRAVCYPVPRGLDLCLRGLRKMSPSGQRPPRLPVQQRHLRAVLARLDRSNARDRVLRAFYVGCWQLVCRCGDLIRGKRCGPRVWDPRLDTHAGRLRFEDVRDASGAAVARRVTLALKPGKTDPTGEKHFEKSCLVDREPGALSFGAEVEDLLRGMVYPVGARSGAIPLFLDPATGSELTYAYAASRLRQLLQASGFSELASGLHSLRIGGATAVTEEGGYILSAFSGKWMGESSAVYQHAVREELEIALQAMGRPDRDGGTLAVRPGPVSRYARPRVRR